jgi:DNA-binding YbaB/EbfC family protein
MFGGMKDMGKMLKRAQEMRSTMKKIQKELQDTEISSETAKGDIKVTINGEMDFLKLSIDPELLTPNNRKKLEAALLDQLNKSIKKAKNLASAKLGPMTEGLKLTGG